jgi:oligosaccharide repeat unit polymerase
MKLPRLKNKFDSAQGQFPPRVTLTQWILVALPVVIAATAYEVTSYNILALITEALSVLGLALLIVVAKEALQTRVIGKLCLVGGVLLFYWTEALALAFQKSPFSVPQGFPINETQFDQQLIAQALIYITVFQLLSLVGYSIRPRIDKGVRFFASRVDSLSFDRWILVFLLVACSVLPLLIVYDFDLNNILTALLASRSGADFEAPEPGLTQHLALFGIYGAALFFVYALKTSTWLRLWWLLLGAIVAVPFVTGGTRHLWLYISLPSVLIVLRGFKGQLNGRRVMGFAAAALIVLVVAQVQFAYRNVGWQEVGDVAPEELSQLSSTGQFTALLFAEHLVPNEHAYFMEPAEPYFLIHWIPRQVWPNKPIMESWAYYNESYVQGAAYNVTPSVIGQFHLNWGLPGVIFIGAWLGFLTCLADRVLLRLDADRQRAMFVVAGMFYAFIISSFRFYSPIYFSYFLFGVLAMLLLTRRRGLSSALAKLTPRLAASPNPS